MKRREVLRSGLALAAGAVGSHLIPAAVADDAAVLSSRLASLAKGLRGTLVSRADPAYGMASLPWNAQFDSVKPVAIAQVADEVDVAETIAFARQEGLDFVMRNGGHSFAGFSATPGIVIDVGRLTTVRVDLPNETATVGAGMTNLPLYEELWPHRMVVPAGTCPTVGITGLALGGGFGRLSPLYGLTCDNLLGAKIVTADGRILSVNGRENSDLFWACRGGGGGNFGAVTELEFRLRPADMPFTEVQYTFAWDAALPVLRAWQQWIAELPREGHSELLLVTGAPAPDGGATVKVDFTFGGDPERAEALGQELVGAAGVVPAQSTTTTASFVSTERGWICAGLRPDECTYEGLTPHGTLARTAIFIESDYVFDPWPDSGLELVIDAIDRRQKDRTFTPEDFNPDAQVGKLLLESCGGAIDDTAVEATAFPHRGMLYMAQYQSRWLPGSDPEIAAANIAWTRAMYESVAAYRSGASYSNYADRNLEDWPRAYYGANLPRLREIKRKYDPDNAFRFAQSIPI